MYRQTDHSMTASDLNRDNIFEKISKCLKESDGLEICSSVFSELNNDYQRVLIAHLILKYSKLLPPGTNKSIKCPLEAERYRNEGNSAFRKKCDIDAIKFYNKSVAFAPLLGKELSLAFANRSAVLYSLGEYNLSLLDINRALDGEYPDHLRYKLLERKGRCLLILGMKVSAKENFENAIIWLEKSELDKIKQTNLKITIGKVISSCNNEETIQQEPASTNYIPSISYSSNLELTSASSALEIKFEEDLGRFLVATRDILPGDILVVEKSYASVVLPSAYCLYCYNCHLRCHSMIPCSTCTLALYCSETCRQKSWLLSHHIECNVIPCFLSFGFGQMELLSLRILLTAINDKGSLIKLLQDLPELDKYSDLRTKGFNDKRQYDSSNYRTIHHLVGNTEYRSNSDLFRRSVSAACMLQFIDQYSNLFLNDHEISVPNFETIEVPLLLKSSSTISDVKVLVGGLLLKYLQSLPSNAHEVTEMIIAKKENDKAYDSYEMGGAAYPVLSLTNHSCDPNVCRHSYNGDTAVLTAIQFIPQGEQIFDNYGYHHAVHTKHVRQTKLQQQYYFSCRCVACVDDWPQYNDLPDDNPSYHDLSLLTQVEKSSEIFKKVFKDVMEGKTAGKLKFLYDHLLLLHKSIKRPWKQYSECQETIKQCLSIQGNHYIHCDSSNNQIC